MNQESILLNQSHYIGKISNIQDSILLCDEIHSNPFIGEIVYFNNNLSYKGLVFEMSLKNIKILLLDCDQKNLFIGDSIIGSRETIKIKVGFHVLGNTITPFGNILNKNIKNTSDFLSTLFETEYCYVSNKSPSIIDRKKVSKPLLTGINSIDCLFPIGLGQRQLIIGDNNTGKTSLAVSSILNQKRFNLNSKIRYYEYARFTYFKPCIYVFIGQKRSESIRIQQVLSNFDSTWYTSIIFSSSDDLPIIQYYAPYTGCVIGEWFMDKGFDSILVFDDLSKHSVAYRQITLLLRRPPGREAFPGDVFFLHSRLLERSAQLSSNNGEGSMTSLPIIETLCGDVSSYIPTNVISITDGQIFLNKELLNRGVLPAVDLNLSVSRVGSSSQYKYMVSVSKKIKMHLAMYRQFKDAELLGTDSNENVKNYVNRGKRLILLFTQPLYHTQNYLKQIIYLYCLSEGFADKIDLKLTKFFLSSIFNSKFYIYIPSDISVFFIDFFRSLETCEDHFVIFDFDVIHSKLYKLLFYYTVFFESNIVPIINGFKDQSYMESLISKYNDSF